MPYKLTINVPSKSFAERAKRRAKKDGKTLSEVITQQLESYSNPKINLNSEIEITERVKRMTGVIKLPKNFNYKKELSDILAKKYKI